jgi:hypothetical protein
MNATTEPVVSFPKLTADLGISRTVRADMLARGYVHPVKATHRGISTMIPASDAERVRHAVTIAALTGIAILTVMALLVSGYVTPKIP